MRLRKVELSAQKRQTAASRKAAGWRRSDGTPWASISPRTSTSGSPPSSPSSKGRGARRSSTAIATAREEGDLSENFEYHAAKNEQGLLERKITILRARLEDAVIVEGGDPEVVAVGSRVVIEDGEGGGMEVEISGLGGNGTTSPTSPLGAALLGRRVGETVDVRSRRAARGRRRSSRSSRVASERRPLTVDEAARNRHTSSARH